MDGFIYNSRWISAIGLHCIALEREDFLVKSLLESFEYTYLRIFWAKVTWTAAMGKYAKFYSSFFFFDKGENVN